jgi:methionyl-tRNA formyltransferase
MTTMELNAMRGELAREILNIESMELLQKVQRYIKRAVKVEQEEVEYIEKEEILNSIRKGLSEIKEARRTGRKLMTAEELLNEL